MDVVCAQAEAGHVETALSRLKAFNGFVDDTNRRLTVRLLLLPSLPPIDLACLARLRLRPLGLMIPWMPPCFLACVVGACCGGQGLESDVSGLSSELSSEARAAEAMGQRVTRAEQELQQGRALRYAGRQAGRAVKARLASLA